MAELGCVWFLILTLLAALPAAQTEDVPTYFANGKSLVLTPPRPAQNNIVWKVNGNLVVECDIKTGDLEYYGSFRGRSNLNKTTGRLEIQKTTKDDQGVYTVEIDHTVLDVNYVAKIPNEVPTPEVVVQPLSCSSHDEICTFSCEGDTTGAGRVTYSWKKGEEQWVEGGKSIDFIKTKEEHIKTITCRMENVVGLKESKPLKNPFISDEKGNTGAIVAAVVGGLLLVGAVAAVVMWKKDEIRTAGQRLFQNGGPNAPTDENRGKPADPSYSSVTQNSSA